MQPLPVFDCDALFRALDERRQDGQLGWYELADELWQQSSELNAQRDGDHPLCGGAVQRLPQRGATSCQYTLFMLRWLGRAPEDFLTGPVVDVGDSAAAGGGGQSAPNLCTTRLADMGLVMRVTQWLRWPAAAFIHPAQW